MRDLRRESQGKRGLDMYTDFRGKASIREHLTYKDMRLVARPRKGKPGRERTWHAGNETGCKTSDGKARAREDLTHRT